MLRDYEILYIVRPELDEEQMGEAVQKVNALIESLGGATENTNVWGKRRLAYEVDRVREGQYVLTDFRLEPARVPEMESTLKISDTVFRHLIVRKPEKRAAAPKKGAKQAPAGETAGAAGESAVPSAAGPESEPDADVAGSPTVAAIAEAEPPAEVAHAAATPPEEEQDG